jgi:hypothetical protein
MDAFHHNMFDTIRAIHNQEYDLNMKTKNVDEVYNNQFVGHLTALLSIARLFDNEPDVDAALNGGAGARFETILLNAAWSQLLPRLRWNDLVTIDTNRPGCLMVCAYFPIAQQVDGARR